MNKRFGYEQVAKPTWNIRLMGRFEIRGKIRSVDASVINEVKSGGKIYVSVFAMRELGFKRELFLVHRVTLR